MTIDEAIKILEEEKDYTSLIEVYGNGDTEWSKAYNMAIEALKLEKSYYDEMVEVKSIAKGDKNES